MKEESEKSDIDRKHADKKVVLVMTIVAIVCLVCLVIGIVIYIFCKKYFLEPLGIMFIIPSSIGLLVIGYLSCGFLKDKIKKEHSTLWI